MEITDKIQDPPVVGLFATCLVDLMRPSVGFATARLLEQAGCRVEVPETQTCCGQPAYNAGDRTDAKDIAINVIQAFEAFDYIVAPSGSCAGMIRDHYPKLFEEDPDMLARARELAARTYELLSFLCDVMKVTEFGAAFPGRVTYHDSCSGLREMGVDDQPRTLMENVAGLELVEADGKGTCCGFGGLFSVKYPDISGKIVDDRSDAIIDSGAETLLGGDLGCLMNIAGRLQRRNAGVETRHLAEVLAGMTGESPPIAGPADFPGKTGKGKP